jgi:hypothetical protein
MWPLCPRICYITDFLHWFSVLWATLGAQRSPWKQCWSCAWPYCFNKLRVPYILWENSTKKHDLTESLDNLLLFITFQYFIPILFQLFFGIGMMPLISFHLAASVGDGLPLMQLDNSSIWMEPLAQQTPSFATHSFTLQHLFSNRWTPVRPNLGTARLFLSSSYELQGKYILLNIFNVLPIFLFEIVL